MGAIIDALLRESADIKPVKDVSCKALGGKCECQVYYVKRWASDEDWFVTCLKYECKYLGWSWR